MDAKMKGMILSGMMGLCLLLGIWGALGSSQLSVAEGEDDLTEDGQTATYSFSAMHATWDLTEAFDGEAKGECDAVKKDVMGEDAPDFVEAECLDDDTFYMEYSLSERCDYMTEELDDMDDPPKEAKEDKEETCDAASAGTMGTIGMWGGIVCALLAVLILVLPMAGVDALDAMPDVAKTIVSWAAGGLMLLGILAWWMMMPDTDLDTGLGMTGWFGIIAAVLGLGAAGMDQFMPAEE